MRGLAEEIKSNKAFFPIFVRTLFSMQHHFSHYGLISILVLRLALGLGTTLPGVSRAMHNMA